MHTHHDKNHQGNSNSQANQILNNIQSDIEAFKKELESLQQAVSLDLLSDDLRAHIEKAQIHAQFVLAKAETSNSLESLPDKEKNNLMREIEKDSKMIQETLGIRIETALYRDNYAATPYFMAYLKRVWLEICEVIAGLLNKKQDNYSENEPPEMPSSSTDTSPNLFSDNTQAFEAAPDYLKEEIRRSRSKGSLPEKQSFSDDASVVSDTTVTTKGSEMSEEELVDYFIQKGTEALDAQRIFRIPTQKTGSTTPQIKNKG